MMKRYKLLVLGLVATMAIATPVFAVGVNQQVVTMEEEILDSMLIINGESIEGKIYTEKGQKMIPLRKTAEALDFKVDYDGKNKTINIDNGIVKTTLTEGKDLYYKASSTALGLTQSISLGVAPTIIDDTTYIPASLYNLLYSNEQIVTVKDNTVIINTEYNKDTLKKITFTIDEKEYNLSMNVPSEVSEYVSFEKEEVGEKENKHIILSLKFSKEDQSANIASFIVYTLNQYETLKKEGGPMPQELISNKENDMVIAFSGLQSNPFEIGIEEAKLVDNYQSCVKQMLETVKLN